MPSLLARRIAAVLVSFSTICLFPFGVRGQEGKYEHIVFRAIRQGDCELLKDLMRRGTPPDVRAPDGTTPLMAAALHGSAEMVALLLQHGADPQAANGRGVTALLWGRAMRRR